MRTDRTGARQSIGTADCAGTRILPDAIVNSYDAGEPLDLIHENYPGLSLPQIQRLIEFAHARRGQPVP